jgi:hypothetical protein
MAWAEGKWRSRMRRALGEAGVGALQLGEEEVEELADLVLGAGQLLGQMLVEMGQGRGGGV